MADVHSRIDEVRGKLPPEVERRLSDAATTFRANHRNPANLAMHLIGYLTILRGIGRLLRGRVFGGLTLVGMGVALLLAGHEIEGTEPFATFRRNGKSSG